MQRDQLSDRKKGNWSVRTKCMFSLNETKYKKLWRRGKEQSFNLLQSNYAKRKRDVILAYSMCKDCFVNSIYALVIYQKNIFTKSKIHKNWGISHKHCVTYSRYAGGLTQKHNRLTVCRVSTSYFSLAFSLKPTGHKHPASLATLTYHVYSSSSSYGL